MGSDYVMGFVVEYQGFVEVLKIVEREYLDKSSRARKSDRKKHWKKLAKVTSRLAKTSSIKSGFVFDEFCKTVGRIYSNLILRWTEVFDEGEYGGYWSGISKNVVKGNSIEDGSFYAGIGDIIKLNEHTSIFRNKRTGEPYSPPQDYGGIIGYWMFHEFTGAGPRMVFNEPGGWAERTMKGTGGFPRRNVILNANMRLVREDSAVWKTLPGNLLKRLDTEWKKVSK